MNDDLISRKETVRFIREKIRLSTFMQRSVDKADKACEELCERIEKEVPTIEPEREKGEWTYPYESTKTICVCSVCGNQSGTGYSPHNFCPHCGADMRGEKNEQR